MATIPVNPTDVKEPLLAFDETTGLIDQYQIFDSTVAMVDARCPYLRSHPIDFATTKFSYSEGEQQHRINVLHVQKPFPVYSGNSYLRNLYRSTGGHLVYTSDYQAGNKFKNYYNSETDAFDGEEVNILRPVYCVDKLRHFLKTVEDSTTISEEYKDSLIIAPLLCGRANYSGNSNFCGAYVSNGPYDEQWIQFVGKPGNSNPDSYAWSGAWRNQGTNGYFVLDGGTNYFGTSWLNTALQLLNNFSIPSASGVGTTDFSTYTLNLFRKNNQIMYGVVGPSNLNQVNGQLTKQVTCEYEIETDAPIVWGIENAIRIASAEEWDDEFLAYILNYGTGGDTPTGEDSRKKWYFWTSYKQLDKNNNTMVAPKSRCFQFVSDGNPIFYVGDSTVGDLFNGVLRIRKNSSIENIGYFAKDNADMTIEQINFFYQHSSRLLGAVSSYSDLPKEHPVVFPKPDGEPVAPNKGKGHYTGGELWVQNMHYYTNIPVTSSLSTVERYLNAETDDERKEILDETDDDYNDDKKGKTDENDLPDIDGKEDETKLPSIVPQLNVTGTVYAMNNIILHSFCTDVLTSPNTTLVEEVIKGLSFFGGNPMDCIKSAKFFPFDILAAITCQTVFSLKVGGVDVIDKFEDFATHVSSGGGIYTPGVSFVDFDFGTLYIPIEDMTWRNFEPYAELYIYLPFVGVYKLDVATYANSNIGIRYRVDLNTGVCTALIFKNNMMMASYDGVLGVDVPLTSADASRYAQMIVQNSLGVAKGVVGVTQALTQGTLKTGAAALNEDPLKAASGIVLNQTQTAFSTMNAGLDLLGSGANLAMNINTQIIQQRGAPQGILGSLLPSYPFIYYMMQQTVEPEDLRTKCGYPSNAGNKVSHFKGFLKAKSVMLQGFVDSITKEEENLIMQYLQNGIYINK